MKGTPASMLEVRTAFRLRKTLDALKTCDEERHYTCPTPESNSLALESMPSSELYLSLRRC
jgi:hypothetical protein